MTKDTDEQSDEEMHRASCAGKDMKLPSALWAEHPPVQQSLCSVAWKLSECCSFCFFWRLLYIGMIDYIRGCWWSTQPSALLPCWGGAESAKPVITYLVLLTTRVFQKPQPSVISLAHKKALNTLEIPRALGAGAETKYVFLFISEHMR